MSATGLEVFDKTVQNTNAWLKEITEATGLDRLRAYHVLTPGVPAPADPFARALAVRLLLLTLISERVNNDAGALPQSQRGGAAACGAARRLCQSPGCNRAGAAARRCAGRV